MIDKWQLMGSGYDKSHRTNLDFVKLRQAVSYCQNLWLAECSMWRMN